MALLALIILFGCICVVMMTIFWALQLLDLMRQKDDAFPGRWDKPLWVAILIFAPLLGAVLYWLRKPSECLTDSPPALRREWELLQLERMRPKPDEAT